MSKNNIHPIFDRIVSRAERAKKHGYQPAVFWFTGLSGSGKSTIAEGVERKLFDKNVLVKVIDGDNTRTGLCNNLGFSLEDRRENIRRVAELSKILNDSGIVTLNSFVSPTKEIRAMAQDIIGPESFYEIFVDTPLEICEKRDVKGLYKKARAGEIKGFTGIDSPFEPPENPHIHIQTKDQSVSESIEAVFNEITKILNLK